VSQQPIDPAHTDPLGSPATGQEMDEGATRREARVPRDPRGDDAGDSTRQQGRQVATDAREQGHQVASHAREEGRQVADTARGEAQGVAETARAEVGRVTDEAKVQTRNLVHQAQDQLKEQAQSQTQRAAGFAHGLADNLQALVEGRPEEAGAVGDYARQATDRIQRFADGLDQRGFDGVIGDVQRYARRRPGVFLLGAAAAGFVTGRLMRGVRDAGDGQSSQPSYTQPSWSDATSGPYGRPEAGTAGTSPTMAGPEAQMPGTTVPPAPGPIEQEPLSRPMTGSSSRREER
jgi:hypothetical protein